MARAVLALRRAPWLTRVITRPLPRQYRRDPGGPPVQGRPAALGPMTPQEIAAVFRAFVPLTSWTRPRFRVPDQRDQLMSRRCTEAGSSMPSRRSGAASG
jgi:hypothetical protein